MSRHVGKIAIITNHHLLARTGRDEEVAKVVAFLGSNERSFMTESEIFVDGGIAQV